MINDLCTVALIDSIFTFFFGSNKLITNYESQKSNVLLFSELQSSFDGSKTIRMNSSNLILTLFPSIFEWDFIGSMEIVKN